MADQDRIAVKENNSSYRGYTKIISLDSVWLKVKHRLLGVRTDFTCTEAVFYERV